MTAGEFTKLVRDFQVAEPFRAFTVELTSGDRFEVDHAERSSRARVPASRYRAASRTGSDHETVVRSSPFPRT